MRQRSMLDISQISFQLTHERNLLCANTSVDNFIVSRCVRTQTKFFENKRDGKWSKAKRCDRKGDFLSKADFEKSESKYLTTDEVARILRKTPHAIHQLVYKNQLKAFRPQGMRKLLFRRVDVERFVEAPRGGFK